MDYTETKELEENVKIKNEADKICRDFKNNISLNVKDYTSDGKFRIWHDQHNAIYVKIVRGNFEFICNFLHESYHVLITPESVFEKIKNKDRVINHLKAKIR